jgi:hypothetical protein
LLARLITAAKHNLGEAATNGRHIHEVDYRWPAMAETSGESQKRLAADSRESIMISKEPRQARDV